MSNPLVSVVIPVYNGSNYLSEAIDSALNQTYKNIEIIVIDDGSIDDTETVASKYKDHISYYKQENGGVASALNLGIEKMKGDYFSWLSHDDLYTPDKIEKQIERLKTYDKDTILYSDYGVFQKKSSDFYLTTLAPCSNFRHWITVENVLHGCTLLIPKTAFDKHGNFDVSLRTTQDYDMWYRLAESYQFVHMADMFVLARNHAEQGSIAMSDIARRECDELITRFVNELKADEIISGSKKTLSSGYLEIADSCFRRGFISAHLRALELSGVKNDREKGVVKMNLCQKIKNFAKGFRKEKTNDEKVQELVGCEDLQHKFTKVYEDNLFAGRNSRSGEGSDLVQTEVIRNKIPKLLKKHDVTSMVDAPCGDWYWMSNVDLGIEKYIGVDIVQKMIDKHNKTYGNDKVSFQCINLVEGPIPKIDLIFSRDCLVHLGYKDIIQILKNFKDSGAKYLLTTTFTNRTENLDLDELFWRPLNMEAAPFNFPKPIELINEKCTEDNGNFSDKCLGLWLLSDLKL